MAWNEPGGSGGKDPWGGRNGDQGPPDLDEVVRKMRGKFGGLFGGRGKGNGEGGPPGKGASGIVTIVVLALVIWLIYDASYVIEPAERGVVLRFGQYVDTLRPGLNVRLPRPIERVYRVNVEAVRKEDIGLTKAESLMLTEDENIIDIKFNVQYRVKNARDFLFKVRAPRDTLRQVIQSAVREIVGKSRMDYVITEGRDAVAVRAEQLIQEILDMYGTGLAITSVNMQDAFADAVKAREDEQRFKNEAEAYARDLLGQAKGAVQRTLLDAEGYRARVVESARGEAERFTRLLAAYEKAPEVTRARLYLDAMESVLSNTSKVMADMKGGNNLIYLPLDKLIGSGTAPKARKSWELPPAQENAPPGARQEGDQRIDRRLRSPGGR